jgi:5-methylcytosine-specific restriction enzyme B
MNKADRIRRYAVDFIIAPARHRGDKTITIRVGDIADGMGLKNAEPNIAGAIGSNLFQQLAGVEKIGQEGPLMGRNCLLIFRILSDVTAARL